MVWCWKLSANVLILRTEAEPRHPPRNNEYANYLHIWKDKDMCLSKPDIILKSMHWQILVKYPPPLGDLGPTHIKHAINPPANDQFKVQGNLVSKLTLGPFLTLSVRNGPNLQSYVFQAYISLNPSRVELKYIIHLLKMAKNNYWNKKCQL